MAGRRAWAAAFARQALSDLEAREALIDAELPDCQLLHYLQMASEKVCKAYLHSAGVPVGFTHAVVKKHLPSIVRIYDPTVERSRRKIANLKQLASQIEVLAPSMAMEGASPDNAEYPWPDKDCNPISPLDFEFTVLQSEKEITTMLKLIRKAAEAYVQAAQTEEE